MKESHQSELIAKIEVLLSELRQSLGGKVGPPKAGSVLPSKSPVHKPFSGLTQTILGLIEEGFFDNPKELGEIQRKLRDEGIKKPTTALMRPILVLIRNKKLARTKPPKGHYLYSRRTGS